ncbi:MAG: molecular chaperone DnaJ [Acidimicrobiia bacterium]|nr:molecular chaperone DnaJ [Acidimicrobiia bacterium]
MATDHYQVLGVSRSASADDIKKAYRRLAREYHPDANPDDAEAEARFKEIANAYEVLSDPERRARFDRFGDDGLGGSGTAGDPFGGGINDIFDAFFGGGSPFGGGGGAGRTQSGPPRGADLETVLEIDLDDIVHGSTQSVKVRTAVACDECEGVGAAAGTSPSTCGQCGGSGQVRQVRRSILGQMVTTGICDRCSGLGSEIGSPCPTCSGEGRNVVEKIYTVDVPSGVDHGSTLRLTGRGAVGARGGASGDLYVHVSVRPHERFQRDGDDLVEDLHIAMTQAALGATLPYETFDVPTELVVPAGSGTGDMLFVKGQGVPRLHGRGRGNIIVRLVVDTPTGLSSDEDALLRELAEKRGEQIAPRDESWVGRIKSAFS